MIESVIMGLIYLCLLVICVYLIVWVLAQLGIAIPENVMKIVWVILVLVAILILVRTVLPSMGVRLGKLGAENERSQQAYYATYQGKRIYCEEEKDSLSAGRS